MVSVSIKYTNNRKAASFVTPAKTNVYAFIIVNFLKMFTISNCL